MDQQYPDIRESLPAHSVQKVGDLHICHMRLLHEQLYRCKHGRQCRGQGREADSYRITVGLRRIQVDHNRVESSQPDCQEEDRGPQRAVRAAQVTGNMATVLSSCVDCFKSAVSRVSRAGVHRQISTRAIRWRERGRFCRGTRSTLRRGDKTASGSAYWSGRCFCRVSRSLVQAHAAIQHAKVSLRRLCFASRLKHEE